MSGWERTKLLTKSLIGIILFIIGLVVFRSCDRKKIADITKETLNDNEKTAIIIDSSGKITTVKRTNGSRAGSGPSMLRGRESESTRGSSISVETTIGARETRISIDDHGNVRRTSRIYGLIFEPGCGVYTTTSHTRVFIDSEFAFYKRHGIVGGFGVNLNGQRKLAGHIGYCYTPYFKYFSNTSLVVGVDNKRELLIGFRLKF